MKGINLTVGVFSLLLSQAVYAYVGPGVGLTAIGSVLAFVGTLLLLLVGFVWYPLKRLVHYIKVKRAGKRVGHGGNEVSDNKD